LHVYRNKTISYNFHPPTLQFLSEANRARYLLWR